MRGIMTAKLVKIPQDLLFMLRVYFPLPRGNRHLLKIVSVCESYSQTVIHVHLFFDLEISPPKDTLVRIQ